MRLFFQLDQGKSMEKGSDNTWYNRHAGASPICTMIRHDGRHQCLKLHYIAVRKCRTVRLARNGSERDAAPKAHAAHVQRYMQHMCITERQNRVQLGDRTKCELSCQIRGYFSFSSWQ